MKTVTVSPKFQVVIPREVRESLGIKPGEKMQIVNYDEVVRTPLFSFSVIPAKAGIQSFQEVEKALDPGFHRGDDFLRDHQKLSLHHLSCHPRTFLSGIHIFRRLKLMHSQFVIPEAFLIGNPGSNLLKPWIPDRSTRG